MPDDDVKRCAAPGCFRPLPRAATGRPRRWCGPTCKKAAQRSRQYAARAEAERAAQLEEARAEAARLWRPLEDASRDTGDLAGQVFAAAADDQRPPGELDTAIRDLERTVADLARLARGYRAASVTTARLTAVTSKNCW